MTSGRAVEPRRTFQDHILDALGSSIATRHDGSNIGLAMLLHCSHVLCLMIKHFFPSSLGLTYLRYLVLLMADGYREMDWPSAQPQSVVMHSAWARTAVVVWGGVDGTRVACFVGQAAMDEGHARAHHRRRAVDLGWARYCSSASIKLAPCAQALRSILALAFCVPVEGCLAVIFSHNAHKTTPTS